jgi:hypothetical protein
VGNMSKLKFCSRGVKSTKLQRTFAVINVTDCCDICFSGMALMHLAERPAYKTVMHSSSEIVKFHLVTDFAKENSVSCLQ